MTPQRRAQLTGEMYRAIRSGLLEPQDSWQLVGPDLAVVEAADVVRAAVDLLGQPPEPVLPVYGSRSDTHSCRGCGHSRLAHTHYSASTHCASCAGFGCPAFQRAWPWNRRRG